ncbi:MAG: hypothetical protein ABIV51_02765 [Saprospiraceae bacterium]
MKKSTSQLITQYSICLGAILTIGHLFAGCKALSPQENIEAPVGTYINQTFLDMSEDSLLINIPRYVTELQFSIPDSAYLNNGFEEFYLHTHQTMDTIHMLDAWYGNGSLQNLSLIIGKDGNLLMLDTAYTQNSEPSRFVRVQDAEGKERTFVNELNAKLISGKYQVTDKSGKQFTAEFMDNGMVNSMPDYDHFELCYAGDCANECLKPTNLISFTKKGIDAIQYYAMERDKSNGKWTLYSLSAPQADIQGERMIGDKWLEMSKIK